MRNFVQNFELATMNKNSHLHLLYIKRIRLHHKVLSGVSVNAFKMMVERS